MRKVYLIGIGPGDPKFLTLQAIETIKNLKTFLIPAKKGNKEDLTRIRKNILKFVHPEENYELIELNFPERKKGRNYREKIKQWRKEKARIIIEFLKSRNSLKEVGFLIIGDPCLYDGHIEIFKEVQKEIPLEIEVIPGISAMQILSAKCKTSLNEIAGTITITTSRGLRKMKNIFNTTVVFLDNYETFKLFKNQPLEIYWGAYLGTEKEKLIAGKLKDVADTILKERKELKNKNKYIMEIYFLKPFKDA
ncbi:precorrin-6A synthase (deacetylating) [Thermodesulfobacterium hydrogeniphilum]|uniref:precorrin-6A synthase (deacetylating) n=1 Tax=Thermodesulfobacterium hydrogeniphilum TaxID=161156 RepID=UPI00056DEFF0|nr:precorrin-6A synthase (deacetylating) [Thermodesulfobacterium hydrogeniphilum]